MIFEWYSGSDTNGEAPKMIRQLSEFPDDIPTEDLMGFTQRILEIEEDRNWQGYLKHYLGLQHADIGDSAGATERMYDALGSFDQFKANFKDVKSEYAMSLLFLADQDHSDDEGLRHRYELVLRLVPYLGTLEATGEDQATRFQTMILIGDVVYSVAIADDAGALFRVALELYSAAHHIHPDDPETLERLYYVYCGLGDTEKAEQVFQEHQSLARVRSEPDGHSEKIRSYRRRVLRGEI